MFKRLQILTAVAVLWSTPGAAAAETEPPALTPEGAVAAALAQNRDLAAARFAIEQAKARLVQAGLRPNPEVEFSQSNDLLFGSDGEYNFSLGFRQRFPVTGRLMKAKAVARVEIAMAEAEVRNQERLLAGEVMARTREWLVLQEQIEANQEIQDTIARLVEVSEKRMTAGEVSAADVNVAKLELQRVALAQAEFLSRQDAASAGINGLLGRDPASPLRVTGVLAPQFDPASAEAAARDALNRRPDRQLVALAIDRADADVTLARAEKWEDWSIGADYSRDYSRFAAPIGGKLDNFLGVSVSVPLPLWNKNQGRIIEAQATRGRAGAELHALDLRIATEISTAAAQALRLAASLDRYRTETATLAGENLTLLQKGYADGLVAMPAVLQAQQQLREQRQTYLEILGEFIRAKTAWETAAATFSPQAQPSDNPRTKDRNESTP